MLQMLLERFRRDNRVVNPLTPFLILVSPGRTFAFENYTVPPIVVGFVQVFQGVRFCGVRTVVVEGKGLGDILLHRIGFERLLDQLGKLQSARLENFQAFAHLRRERLLLGERLVEKNVSHSRYKSYRTRFMARNCKMQQNLCQSQIFILQDKRLSIDLRFISLYDHDFACPSACADNLYSRI